jgi:hypothetical protein
MTIDLKKQFKVNNFPSNHEDFLEALEESNIHSLSLECRVVAQKRLIDHVVNEAKISGNIVNKNVPGANKEFVKAEIVDETAYQREISLMLELNKSFAFSDSLYQWINAKRKAYSEIIRNHTDMLDQNHRWETMTLKEKTDYIRLQMDLHTRLYSDENIAFKDSEIMKLRNVPEYVTGATKNEPFLENDHLQAPGIGLSMGLLENAPMYEVMAVVHHEQTHTLLYQLAHATHLGLIDETHPLYQDGHMKAMELRYNLAPPDTIESLYLNNDEEQLAFDQQDRFVQEVYKPETLRDHFYFAQHHLSNYGRKTVSEVKLFASQLFTMPHL